MSPEETAELIRLKQLEADERRSPTEKMACVAWDGVKNPTDACFADLPVDIRYKLINLAEKYAAGKAETEGDYAPAGFYEAVRAQAPEPEPEFSEDTSTHAPNDNFDNADPEGPPLPDLGKPFDAGIPELNSEGSDSAAKNREMSDREGAINAAPASEGAIGLAEGARQLREKARVEATAGTPNDRRSGVADRRESNQAQSLTYPERRAGLTDRRSPPQE